jgi:ABC-type transport system involved in multi-copper enzyme maturation permease subunit
METAFSWGIATGADWKMWLGTSWNIAFPIGLAVLLLRAASRRLHRISFLEKEPSKGPSRFRAAFSPRRPRRLFAFRKSKVNPLLWRETYIRPASRFRILTLLALGLIVLCELSYALMILMVEPDMLEDLAVGVGMIFLVIFCLLTFVLTALSASLSFVTERETKSWEPLLATPVSRKLLVLAKALGTAQDAAPFLLITFFHLGLMYLAQIFNGWQVGMTLSVIMVTLGFVTGVGLVISLGSRRSVRASAAGVVSFLGLAFVLPWFSGLLGQEGLNKILWGASPLYWLYNLSLLDSLSPPWIPWWGIYLFLFTYAVAALSLFLFAMLGFERLSNKT